MNRRVLILMAVMVILISLIAACVPATAPAPAPEEQPVVAEEEPVTFVVPPSDSFGTQRLEELVVSFKEQTGTEVILIFVEQ